MEGSKKILVVDDDPYILMSLEFLMKKNGYDVMVARNGTEALDLVEKQLPDLVLLDIMMPDVDGYEICKHIKKTTKLKHAKVVFMSAKSKEVDIQKGYDLGASLYITKPFSTREMVKKVNELLA
jgi:DNA-binding response OmpR family regulator